MMIGMQDKLTFIFRPEVQEIFNHFTALFDIRIAYFAPDGRELKVGMERPWCEYCRLVRQVLEDEAQCLAQDRDCREAAARQHRLITYRCHAGLTEVIKPLYFDDVLQGFIMIGQIRTNLVLPADKVQRWQMETFAEGQGSESLRAAFESIPLIGMERFNHITGLFSTIVDYVVQQHFIAIRGQKRTSVLVDWLRQHYMEDTTLEVAAGMVGLSPSRLAHLLRAEQGLSFKQLQLSIRLTQARSLLEHANGLSIKEVARRCGFEDPLYFSRVFRKAFGCAPSDHEARVLNPSPPRQSDLR